MAAPNTRDPLTEALNDAFPPLRAELPSITRLGEFSWTYTPAINPPAGSNGTPSAASIDSAWIHVPEPIHGMVVDANEETLSSRVHAGITASRIIQALRVRVGIPENAISCRVDDYNQVSIHINPARVPPEALRNLQNPQIRGQLRSDIQDILQHPEVTHNSTSSGVDVATLNSPTMTERVDRVAAELGSSAQASRGGSTSIPGRMRDPGRGQGA